MKGNFSRELTIQILQIVTQLRKFGKEKILKFDVTVQWRDYSTQLFNWSIILFSLGQFSLILVLSIKFSLVNVFFHSLKTAKSYLVDGGTKKDLRCLLTLGKFLPAKYILFYRRCNANLPATKYCQPVSSLFNSKLAFKTSQ